MILNLSLCINGRKKHIYGVPMQVRKQQLELDMEREQEYVKAVYAHTHKQWESSYIFLQLQCHHDHN